ncbi:T9SS type A sorting domain-containing protein [Aureispira anguillae]|uniref:T9SS type A sorting domain-containing protein n=1 Tax=Aureispira anguillae TaxID=2864201 RepID=A0A916DTC7_9BACT|nr:T9SS type A sorting domain-containing protein [Aureispira anguillae]BDS12471.1 T9SS type A sorting domain-containing protein [Aureispira anguillae]
MIKILSATILVFMLQFTYAQHHLDSTSTWVYYKAPQSAGPVSKTCYRTITIDGDSLIQGKTYFKRYIQGEDYTSNGPSGPILTVVSKQFFDLVRDDAGHFYTYFNGQDTMVMDFTKELGDTIRGSYCIDTINQIDSLYLGSQVVKKWSTGSYDIIPYIEGVGLVIYLTFLERCVLIGNSRYELVCYEKGGDQLILNPTINCQVYNSIATAEKTNLAITVYPNPTSGVLQIQNTSYSVGKIQLFNLNGQLVLEKELEQADQKLDLGLFPVGTYYLKINTDQGSYVKKVLKL